jgi:uncharacterized membrane protein YbhN (UPF0104 family)
MNRMRWLLLAAKVGLSALLLWWVVSKVGLSGIAVRLREAHPEWLLPAVLMGPIVVVLSAWRWQILSLGLLGFGVALRYTWVGLFFGSIVPGAVGGDVAKGISLAAKLPATRDKRLPLSIVIDKLVGVWILLLQFLLVVNLTLLTQPALLPIAKGTLWVASVAILVGLGSALALFQPAIASQIRALSVRLPSPVSRLALKALNAVGSYAGNGVCVLKAAGLSLLIHLVNASCVWMVTQSLAIPATPWFAFLFYSLLTVVLSLPVSISGVGLRDAFAASLFTSYGMAPESGVALSWLLLAMAVPNALIGGAIQLGEFLTESVGSEPKQPGT